MPHLNDVSEGQNSRPSSEVGDKSEGRDVESEDSDLDSDVEADWLDSMGLEKLKKQFPGLRPDSVTRAQVCSRFNHHTGCITPKKFRNFQQTFELLIFPQN